MNSIKAIWNWIQVNSNGLSILLSLLGFLIVWLQLRKTRSATEAATLATKSALRAILNTDTVSDLATIRERLKRVQIALRGGRYEIAIIEAQYLRENLHQLRSRKGFESDDNRTQIQVMVTFLSKLQAHIEKHLEDSSHQMPIRNLNSKLADYSTAVSEWVEQMRFSQGENGHDS